MEADQFKKWLDAAQAFQTEHFWNQIFDEKSSKQTSYQPFQSFSAVKEFIPKCDVFESGNDLIIEAEVPGLGKEDLHISIQKQVLTITGEFRSLRQNCQYHLKERVNRSFKKEITLPYPVLANKVKTEIKKGILVISMPLNRDEIEDIPISFE